MFYSIVARECTLDDICSFEFIKACLQLCLLLMDVPRTYERNTCGAAVWGYQSAWQSVFFRFCIHTDCLLGFSVEEHLHRVPAIKELWECLSCRALALHSQGSEFLPQHHGRKLYLFMLLISVNGDLKFVPMIIDFSFSPVLSVFDCCIWGCVPLVLQASL